MLLVETTPALLSSVATSSSETTTTLPSDLSATAAPFVPTILAQQQRKGGDCPIVDAVPDVTKQQFSSSITKQDRPSLCWTASTSSVTSFDSLDSYSVEDDRKVSFSTELVTDVWTRERTLPEDVPKLFYSSLETQEFRRQYHADMERERELAALKKQEQEQKMAAEMNSNFGDNGSRFRRRISRVIIEHDNKQETFFQFPETPKAADHSPDAPSFFDNDSFWTGSLTWY